MDYIPSFCTACYREGRTGDRFMALCKSMQILNCCHPNALMTLKAVSYTHLDVYKRQIQDSTSQQKLCANVAAQIVAFACGKADDNKNKNFEGGDVYKRQT